MIQHNQPSDSPAADKSSATAVPALSLPKGGGAIRGIGEKFAANPALGTGAMTVPLPLSPGRQGFAPQLTLAYDTGAGNGPFGYGWRLSLPSIVRKTEKGLPSYRDAEQSDVFLLSGSEDLVPVDGSGEAAYGRGSEADFYSIVRYRPRVEGTYAIIERWTHKETGETHWRSVSGDNIASLYGKTADSRIADPRDPARRTYEWLLCETRDDKGNAIVYEYKSENAEGVDLREAHEQRRERTANRYLKRVKYGNRVPTLIEPDLSRAEWLFEAVFDYGEGHEESYDPFPEMPAVDKHRYALATATERSVWQARPDPFSFYRSGFEVRTYRRCHRVLMFHRFAELGSGLTLVRSAEFGYDDFDYAGYGGISEELGHAGSTRFGSFLMSVVQSGYVRQLPADRAGEDRDLYLRKSTPPLTFTYAKAVIQSEARELEGDSLLNLPSGTHGSDHSWVDLKGEGVPGVLTRQADAWHYKPNLGGGRLGRQETVSPLPAFAGAAGAERKLIDIDGDGLPEWTAFGGILPGYSPRDGEEEGWGLWRPFEQLPNVAWDDPHVLFVDLNGDGRPDVLLAGDEAFSWHPSLGPEGFGPAIWTEPSENEETEPRLVMADGIQSVYLADMTGDGLTDLVRIRNGEVCYWPNTGYGRFGQRIDMSRAPWFDHPELFDRRQIRLADLDGSGTVDIVYAGRDGVHLYFNQSGNRWSEPRSLAQLPPADEMSTFEVADLLGNGTACLIWSTAREGAESARMRYVDLMGGIKPHLMTGFANHLGMETRIYYAPSTQFYLADKQAGRPWISKLPFPVYTVERIETFDRISGHRFVTRYAYRHGYYDETEREFRGFGLVEQWDTDDDAEAAEATNVDAATYAPPVWTRTWYHTGIDTARSRMLCEAFASGETQVRAAEPLLDEPALPAEWSTAERAEAYRALRGLPIRLEIYALDGGDRQHLPYTVSERSYGIRCLQRKGDRRHGVFTVDSREQVVLQSERNAADPRISHELTLEVDRFGHALRTASVAYGRSTPDPALEARDRERQAELHIVVTEHDYTNAVETAAAFRTPLPSDTREYEFSAPVLCETAGGLLAFADVKAAAEAAEAIPYEAAAAPETVPQKRLFTRVRTLYRSDDLTGPLPQHVLASKALPFESYKLVFTPGWLSNVYGDRVTASMLSEEGGFVRFEGEADGAWWAPTGRSYYSPEEQEDPASELSEATAHFYTVRRYRDPFYAAGSDTDVRIRYDAYDLLMSETVDALGNRITALETDYRVLQPVCVSDPNGNLSAVRFDALGLVVGTALSGKPDAAPRQGDTFEGFAADLTDGQIAAYLNAPSDGSRALLARATTRLVYDWFAYERSQDETRPEPAFISTLARDIHDADLPAGGAPAVQTMFAYYDGFGREIQKKLMAEPGAVPSREPGSEAIAGEDSGRPAVFAGQRWTGDGWTIFDNKDRPVMKYEPFFTDTHRYEPDVKIGVGTRRFYDALGRAVGALHPDRTWEKVRFDPWTIATYKVKDTVLEADPRLDPDIGGYFARLPKDACMPTWYASRIGGDLGPREREAAMKAAVHADTPSIVCIDALGRAFLSIVHNRFRPDGESGALLVEERYATRVAFDIEGHPREVFDALDRVAERCKYDMLGRLVYRFGMDSGESRFLADAFGQPIRSWSSRGYEEKIVYDALRRPIQTYKSDAAGQVRLTGRTVYGESLSEPEARNLRGQVVQVYDQAGMATSETFDFKGNLLHGTRRLAKNYKEEPDWSFEVPMESKVYETRTRYDALGRKTEIIAPDGSVLRTGYNDANLPESIEANLRGELAKNGERAWTVFVTNIDYDAKGQRTKIEYGNGAVTHYAYDPLTCRLTRLRTRRSTPFDPGDCPEAPVPDWPGCGLQNFSYVYEPSGNVVHIRDDAQQTIFFRNKRVEPSSSYTYDAIGRLIEASGREHLGQNPGGIAGPSAPEALDGLRSRLAHPGDGAAMGTYVERYAYDAVGNLLSARHRGTDPAHQGWRRCYLYAQDSNRLLARGAPEAPDDACPALGLEASDLYQRYAYDANGNMSAMPHLQRMTWDGSDRLRSTSRQASIGGGTPETTWYVYDAGGARVRKTTERQAEAGFEPVRMKEVVYLGLFEIYREYGVDGHSVSLERETLCIGEDARRVALVETRTAGSDEGPARLIRYQLGNHLGSVSLELDESARIISYEEYFPFGSTSYQAVRLLMEAPKRYRYSGKERDEESGLYYHGARYYSSDIARWISPDPPGTGDGVNRYAAFRNNPLTYADPSGLASVPPNFVEYADSLHGGLFRMAELGLANKLEFALVKHPVEKGPLMIIEGTETVNFGNYKPLGHTHTSLSDKKVGPSSADLYEVSTREVAEHWIYSTEEGWGRLRYEASDKSFEFVRRNSQGELVRTISKDTLGYDPGDDVGRAYRWQPVSKEIIGEADTFEPELIDEKAVAARRGLQKEISKDPLKTAPKIRDVTLQAKTSTQSLAEAPLASSAETTARSLGTRIGSAVDAATPAVSKGLAVAGTAYAAYDIVSNTIETTREQGAMQGVAQASKTSAKHVTAALWFAAGGAVALTLVTGGMAAPLAAAAIGAIVAGGGTMITHRMIDEANPNLR